MRKLLTIALSGLMLFAVAGCYNKADTISHNIGQEADQFNVLRRIVFVNGITDQYLLSIEGFCSLGNDRSEWELSVTCKTGVGEEYKKHFLGLSDNVTYFVEQLESNNVDPAHYKVIFRPSILIPDVEIQ
jgi:hypothetical protein